MFTAKLLVKSLILALFCLLFLSDSAVDGAVLSRYGKRQWDAGLQAEENFSLFGNQNVVCRSVGFGDLYKCHMAGAEMP